MCIATTPTLQVGFTKGVNKLIDTICEEIIDSWPPFKDNEAYKNTLILVNGFAFYTAVFQGRLQDAINADTNRHLAVRAFFPSLSIV